MDGGYSLIYVYKNILYEAVVACWHKGVTVSATVVGSIGEIIYINSFQCPGIEASRIRRKVGTAVY